MPQLLCVGGSAGNREDLRPTSVQCQNMGSDGQSINWKCLAELDSSVKFGTINVNCEGFLSPEDEYVLAGSCGLEYELDFTAKGKHDNYQATGSDTESGGGGAFVFFVIIALVAAYIIYSCNTSEETQRPPVIPYRPPVRSEPDDIQIPPPAFGSAPPLTPPFPHSTPRGSYMGTPPPMNTAYGYGGAGSSPINGMSSGPFMNGGATYPAPPGLAGSFPPTGAGAPNANGPGFWTGFAAGGVVGSLLSNRGGSSAQAGSYPPGPASSIHHHHPPSQPHPTPTSPSSSTTTSTSTETRTATGFAKTKKR